MGEFSLELNDEQLQLQEWVHQFAEDVIRPAAEEWDEREVPVPHRRTGRGNRPVLMGVLANGMLGDKTGLTIPVAIEELFWGDAGIGMAIMGSGLAASGIAAAGAGAAHGVGAPVLRRTGQPGLRGVLCQRARRRLRRSRLPHRAVYDEATDEWVLDGTKAWITNGA